MTPAMQTIMPGDGRTGDCLRACLASLLDVKTEQVPHYMMFDDWREKLNAWLEQERGMALVELDAERGLDRLYPLPPRTFLIVAGTTHRHPDRLHAVVARTFGDYSWQYLHDPHPSREFILKPKRLLFLTLTDPCERFRRSV